MKVFDTLFESNGATKDEETESRWVPWQRRTFYALGVFSIIGLIGVAVAAPSRVAAAMGTIMGGFAMLLIVAYLATGVTRRIRSQLQQRGYNRHFSDRYWATLSYLSVIIAPIATLATNLTAATSAESTNVIAMYLAVFIVFFILSLPFYELSKIAKHGYSLLNGKDTTPQQ